MEANPAIALFLALGLIILASRIGGAIARRFHQPRVLGELIIGVMLGPTLLNILHWDMFHGVELEATIKEFAELGVLLLMFIVGMEVNFRELTKVGRVGIFAGVLGAGLPILMGFPLVMLFDYTWQPALFAGVTLAATSVSISAQVLLELGFLRTKEGNALLATALIDDVLAILLVSLAIAVVGTGESSADVGELVTIVVRMGAYIGVAFGLAWFVVPALMNWLDTRPHLAQSYGIPAFGLILALFFGWTAEEFGGVATITGAFIAGIGITRTRDRVREQVEESTMSIAYAFLVPIFFIDVGLETDLSAFPMSALPFAGLLLIIALISKVAGCGFGARMGGFNRQESLRVGVCMISRGEVGLIIASLGISAGVFTADEPIFASLFLVILLTTLITPILVRQVFPSSSQSQENNA